MIDTNPANLSPANQKQLLRLCLFHERDFTRWYCCVFGGSPCRLLTSICREQHARLTIPREFAHSEETATRRSTKC